MRDIKFRGKRKSDNTWIYGSLLVSRLRDDKIPRYYIIPLLGNYTFDNEVNPETIGQYTGKKDVNNKEIYEGDIWVGKYYCCNNPQELQAICVMKWDDNNAHFHWDDIIFGMPDFIRPEVCGNIHDNPELIPYSPDITKGTKE